MKDISIVKLCQLYIQNTEEKQPVFEKTILICNVTNVVKKVCSLKTPKVYINTKILKHLYDKKPAEEFNFIVRNIHAIIKYPTHIYMNKESKRGDYIFTKIIKNKNYLCSVEVIEDCLINGIIEHANVVATCFRIRDEKYLKKYELMWSWKGGNPSS